MTADMDVVATRRQPVACDYPSIIDRVRFVQLETGAGRNEVIQVINTAGFPQNRMHGLAIRES